MQKRIKKSVIILIAILSFFTLCGCDSKQFKSIYNDNWYKDGFIYPDYLKIYQETVTVRNDSAEIIHRIMEFEGNVELANFNEGKALEFIYNVTEYNEVGNGFKSKYDGNTLLFTQKRQNFVKKIEGGIELKLDLEIFLDDLKKVESYEYIEKEYDELCGAFTYAIENASGGTDMYYVVLSRDYIMCRVTKNTPFYENGEYVGDIYERYNIEFYLNKNNYKNFNVEVEETGEEYLGDFNLHF